MKRVDSGEFYSAKQDNVFSEYKPFRAEEYYPSEFGKTPQEINSYNESYNNQGVKSTKSEGADSADAKEIQRQYDKLNQSDPSDVPGTSSSSTGATPSPAAANASQTATTVSGGAATAAGGATVGVTAVAAVVIVSAAVTGGFVTDFNSYIGNSSGTDYVAITVDMDEILSQTDKNYGLSAENFSIELTEGATSRKVALVDGKHSYLITGLQPEKTYSYNLICNSPSLGSNSNCCSQSFTTLSVGEPKGVYDELNNCITYDEVTRTASVYYSVYLSDYENEYADSTLYICSSEQAALSDMTDIVYSDDAPDENNFFKGVADGITCDELYIYVVGERATEYGAEAVELFSYRLTVDLPEEWQTVKPAFEVDQSAEVTTALPDAIGVSGKLNKLNESYDYSAYVIQYNGDGKEIAERQDADLTVDFEKMTYSLGCGAYYGVNAYKYVIYTWDGDDNQITVYESEQKPFTASQAFGATYTRVEPANAKIEYGANGITITAETQFTSEYNNCYYKLTVTNSEGVVYGEYTGTDTAAIEIADVTGLDEINFTYCDFGTFADGETEYGAYGTEGVAFCIPAVSLSAEHGFNGQYFTLSYVCDMVYDYANASMKIEVNDGTNVYVKHVESVSEKGTVILDNIQGEVGEVTVSGTLNFTDYQADGAIHSVGINQSAYAMNYSFEITSVKADITGYSTESMVVTLDFDYLLPEGYKIEITDEENSLSLTSDLTERYSFSELAMDAEANLTIRVTDGNGNAWGEPKTVNISPSAASAEFVSPTMSSPNPGDAVVTYNDDGTINIYREMIPSAFGRDTVSDDQRVYYNAFVQGYTFEDYNGDEVIVVNTEGFDVIGRGKYAAIENIPDQNYTFIYYTMFDYNGVSYAMYAESPSGSVEKVDNVASAMVTYGDGNTTVSLTVTGYGKLGNKIIINGVEYEYTTYSDESETAPELIIEGEIDVSEVTIMFTAQGYYYDEYAASGEITMKGNKYASHVITVKT